MIGDAPRHIGFIGTRLTEVMYYLYLPVVIGDSSICLPRNVEPCREIIEQSIKAATKLNRKFRYVYLSARRGFATPDNPLNRPGWHCDGYGTDDLNYVWWDGPGTRFAVQKFTGISVDHKFSLEQFQHQVKPEFITSGLMHGLYELTPDVVHATPIIPPPGCMRQYVKVSLSNSRYNLEGNSHNYMFDYDWNLQSRELVRNSPHSAQRDSA